MKIPPRWVFDIWNESSKATNFYRGTLRTLPKDCDELETLMEDVELDVIALGWALYVCDRSDATVLNDETKFAFTSFLKAGGGHLATAAGILDGRIKVHYRTDEAVAYETAKKVLGWP